MRDTPKGPIRAAGGVVWEDLSRARLAVVFRDRHFPNECSLPKGKLEPGEGWEEAARREVLEETGCVARIQHVADVLHYRVNGVPKTVVFFEMVAHQVGVPEPSGEVKSSGWAKPEDALKSLSYAGERRVLRECIGRRAARVSDP
ncbi:MAG: NUDIX domain-containing protein [Bryobacterales bacterium]|nr:NUDIX domain-containing protein [Bryobacterales bacterium]